MPTTSPKISVCIPTYNRANTLKSTIDSILTQSFTNFEVLIVDNCSTDNTSEVVNRFSDRRLRYFVNSENIGMVKNWNRCISLASGEYIAIFHDDDIYEQDILKSACDLLDTSPNVGFVHFSTWYINDKNEKIGKHQPYNKDTFSKGKSFIYRSIKRVSTDVVCPSVVSRKYCFDQCGVFNDKYKVAADQEMWLRIAKYYDVYYINKPLMRYNISHEGNITGILDLFNVFNDFILSLNYSKSKKNKLFVHIKFKFIKLLIRNTLEYISRDNINNAKKSLDHINLITDRLRLQVNMINIALNKDKISGKVLIYILKFFNVVLKDQI